MKHKRALGAVLASATLCASLFACTETPDPASGDATDMTAQTTAGTAEQTPAGNSSQNLDTTPLADVATEAQKAVLTGNTLAPVAVGCREFGADGERNGLAYGDDAVEALRSYLNSIEVGAATDTIATDADKYYEFYFADGTITSFYLQADCLEVEGELHRFTASEKLKLEFAGNDTSLALDPPTPEYASFMEHLESESPVSVTVEGADSKTFEGTEAADLAESLWYMELYNALDAEAFADLISSDGLEETSYTFTWADGNTFTMRFMSEFLCVDVPSLGTWGFYAGELPGNAYE